MPEILPLVERPPVIDGKVSPGEWNRAIRFEGFSPSSPDEDIAPTTAYVTSDGSWLYIAFQCTEPNPSGVVTKVIADERDAPVWRDDSVEVFIDPGNTGRVLYHFIANSQGTYFDAMIVDLKSNAAAWSSEARVHTGRTRDGWEIEIALPLASMRHILSQGEILGINLARNRFASGGERPEMSSIAMGVYAHPSRFIKLLVGGEIVLPDGGGKLVVTKAGPFLNQESGSWEFRLTDAKAEGEALEFSFPAFQKRHSVKVGTNHFSFPFKAGEAHQMQECTIRVGEAELAHYAYEAQTPIVTERIARTQDPLFEALIEPMPEGLAREGFVLWPHQLSTNRRHVPDFLLRTAMAHTEEQTIEWYRKHGAIRLSRSAWYRTEIPHIVKIRDRFRDAEVPGLVYVIPTDHLAKEVPIGPSHGRAWDLDPRVKAGYLEDARQTIELSKEYPDIRWLFAGDETWEIMHRNLLHFLGERERYPELAAVDQEIREKYGFGKYGLPLSETDTNPFRWIATRRWEIDQMIGIQAEVRAMVQEKAPHLKMLSWDNISGHRPYGLHRWSEVFDVITGQLYPARIPERQVFTFLAHWYRDLTGAKEFWFVPHFENYAATFNQEETEELFSQLFRGGATGLHLYLADTIGERRGKASPVEEIWGAPERWAVVASVIEKMRKQPFRVKQPQPDTGIFYSNTSYAGQGVGSGAALMYTNEVEWIYTLLGPHLHSAIRFLDEGVADRTAKVLEQLKVVYLPYGPIMDDAEVQALEQFVKRGGTLIVCDPLAFRHRSDGTVRTESPLLVPLESEASGVPMRLSLKDEAGELSPTGPTYRLRPTADDRLLASYPGGGAALIATSLGKGRVIKFGMNPLAEKTIKDAPWIRLFAQFQKQSGTVAANDLWRFRFPPVGPLSVERPEGVCLTGNYFEWEYSEPKPKLNSSHAGTYELSRADRQGKEAAGQPVAFSKGKLTDRIQGANAENLASGSDFLLEWTGGEPLEIRWQFASTARPRVARIFYRGHLPGGQSGVLGPDGRFIAKGPSWAPPEPLNDAGLRVLEVTLDSAETAEPVLRFEPTVAADWSIAEVEWWGAE